MKGKIVRIGNSQGVRIPKPLLEQTGLADEVEINVEENRIVISPAEPEVSPPRKGWAKAFKAMAAAGDDVLLDGERPLSTKWDEEEWEWE
ncbi:AbrB/MazE/SpoVT family DNA-binding domain-containing protein [Candidatus Eisenbacteria bacterium]|uniref:AbrB/MazE/SpoVT family DNA-binding domain-containing protein n=1 Tax=Eiseniibacteriota bacterium TaxID=2212470 RepID=A0ABV6YK55_UNCEI